MNKLIPNKYKVLKDKEIFNSESLSLRAILENEIELIRLLTSENFSHINS